MGKRFVSVWFSHLHTDWFSLRDPSLSEQAFVLSTPSHGRMVISSTNPKADQLGIYRGMVVADARAIFPSLVVKDDIPDLSLRLLNRIGEWCIRFTPFVAADLPDGLIIEATGCAHLWRGEEEYIKDICNRLEKRGYKVKAALADTAAQAWAIARYGNKKISIVEGQMQEEFLQLPPEALRIDELTVEKLHKLGLTRIRSFIGMARPTLQKRFGNSILTRINQSTGAEIEVFTPIIPVEPYEERLPCLEPIITGTGIEIALRKLLEGLIGTLSKDQKGIRSAVFRSYAADGEKYDIDIETNRSSLNADHLYALFHLKLNTVIVSAGIELFTMTATRVEEYLSAQEKIWENSFGLSDIKLAELIDNIESRNGKQVVKRYLPAEHHLPEKSVKQASSLLEEPASAWKIIPQRPLHILKIPEKIEVTAPIPDYPPMMFRYKGKIHKITRADGPERIEQEWWVAKGRHRDYYAVEDDEGKRYWLFRSGHYDADKTYSWFIHGFFV
jgi:protein ImuB